MSRKYVFQKDFLVGLYAKCRELIQRCCTKFIETWQRFLNGFPCFFCFFFFCVCVCVCVCVCGGGGGGGGGVVLFFQITFDLLFTNTSRLDTRKYNLFDCDFYWWPRVKQTTKSNMVWYLNMNKSTYRHWSKYVGENLPSAMHFIIFVTYRFLYSESTLMFIYHRHIFVL